MNQFEQRMVKFFALLDRRIAQGKPVDMSDAIRKLTFHVARFTLHVARCSLHVARLTDTSKIGMDSILQQQRCSETMLTRSQTNQTSQRTSTSLFSVLLTECLSRSGNSFPTNLSDN